MEDTIGLQNFFNENSEDYWWEQRVEVSIFILVQIQKFYQD